MARTQEPEVKEQLKTDVANAVGAGIFGVPTMQVDDEFFWGNDQFDNLATYVRGEDVLDPDWMAAMERAESSVTRRK